MRYTLLRNPAVRVVVLCVLAAPAVWAQAPTLQNAQAAEAKPTPEIDPDTVVAEVNGKKMTAAEVKNMVANIPPQAQQAFANNPQQFMREYAWYMLIQGLAEKAGLDKKTPYKERVDFQKMLILVQAMYDTALMDVTVSREEERAFYTANEQKYKEVQTRLIYISFSTDGAASAGGKKVLAEAEAKAKAELVVKQARGGADFVKLVKQHSEDTGSVAQNGDIGGVRSTTTHIPETMRNAILALSSGQISDPVRHDNGYYVFRAESVGVLPYEKVREEIYKELKQAGFRKWQQKTQSESAIKFDNEEFFRNFAKDVQQSK